MPAIICTDTVSDVGYVVTEAGCGYKVISGDLDGFKNVISNLVALPGILRQQYANARALFERIYTTEKAYNVIKNRIKG